MNTSNIFYLKSRKHVIIKKFKKLNKNLTINKKSSANIIIKKYNPKQTSTYHFFYTNYNYTHSYFVTW